MPAPRQMVTTPLGVTMSVAPGSADGDTTWILLHGSDGAETDLLPLADRLTPGAGHIAPRGDVLTPRGFAFVDRRADRSFDADDVLARVAPLADAISSGQRLVGDTRQRLLLGFSNGAVMGAALVEQCPELFSGAVLIRPQVPPGPPPPRADTDLPVLVLDARYDARRSAQDGLLTARRLREAGATVEHVTLAVHHAITDDDERAIRSWLGGTQPHRSAERA